MLNSEQIEFAKKAFKDWLRIYRENDSGQRHNLINGENTPTLADVDHSSLLYRLLSGKNSLSKPPPRRWSYPDYKLGDGDEVEVSEINIMPDCVVIDQCPDWHVELNPANLSALQILNITGRNGLFLKHKNGDFYLLSEREGKRFLGKILNGEIS